MFNTLYANIDDDKFLLRCNDAERKTNINSLLNALINSQYGIETDFCEIAQFISPHTNTSQDH